MLSTKVGEDQYGNEYFLGFRKDYLGRHKRYVIYKGIEESSKVPPVWHAWLHYAINELPDGINNYQWQQDHKPNLTGTDYAFDPSESESKKIDLYQRWQP